jgi:hypothetical protein
MVYSCKVFVLIVKLVEVLGLLNQEQEKGVWMSDALLFPETMGETVTKRAMTRSVPKEESHFLLI